MPGQRQASISQQLMILRKAGLVDIRRDGPNVYYGVAEPQVFHVLAAIYSATGKLIVPAQSAMQCSTFRLVK